MSALFSFTCPRFPNSRMPRNVRIIGEYLAAIFRAGKLGNSRRSPHWKNFPSGVNQVLKVAPRALLGQRMARCSTMSRNPGMPRKTTANAGVSLMRKECDWSPLKRHPSLLNSLVFRNPSSALKRSRPTVGGILRTRTAPRAFSKWTRLAKMNVSPKPRTASVDSSSPHPSISSRCIVRFSIKARRPAMSSPRFFLIAANMTRPARCLNKPSPNTARVRVTRVRVSSSKSPATGVASGLPIQSPPAPNRKSLWCSAMPPKSL